MRILIAAAADRLRYANYSKALTEDGFMSRLLASIAVLLVLAGVAHAQTNKLPRDLEGFSLGSPKSKIPHGSEVMADEDSYKSVRVKTNKGKQPKFENVDLFVGSGSKTIGILVGTFYFHGDVELSYSDIVSVFTKRFGPPQSKKCPTILPPQVLDRVNDCTVWEDERTLFFVTRDSATNKQEVIADKVWLNALAYGNRDKKASAANADAAKRDELKKKLLDQ